MPQIRYTNAYACGIAADILAANMSQFDLEWLEQMLATDNINPVDFETLERVQHELKNIITHSRVKAKSDGTA